LSIHTQGYPTGGQTCNASERGVKRAFRYLSLFSGIGGIDLGLDRAGMTCVGQVEIDPFGRAVLEKHWPGVARYADVRTVTGDEFGSVDLVAGGFPCQPVSVAGKGLAQADDRWLWPECARLVAKLRPRWCLFENVPGLRGRGADFVLGDLEALGYACRALVVGAEHVGAPHKRHRVWIVANAKDADRRPEPTQDGGSEKGRGRSGSSMGGDADLADASGPRLEERRDGALGAGEEHALPAGGGRISWPARPGQPQHGWERPRLIDFMADANGAPLRDESGRCGWAGWPGAAADRHDGAAGGQGDAQRRVGSTAHGLPAGLVRLARRHNRNTLKAAGNAVVPAVVELIGRAILAAHSPTNDGSPDVPADTQAPGGGDRHAPSPVSTGRDAGKE